MNRQPIHPGEILREEFLIPLGIKQSQLAKKMGVKANLISYIVNNKRKITAKTALLLSCAVNTTPQFWLNLQNNYDLYHAEKDLKLKK